ncbi:type IV pilin [Halobellus sp. Atlit-31R]|nr:type IV pilin [Halobellus sp. Atlit-31R]
MATAGHRPERQRRDRHGTDTASGRTCGLGRAVGALPRRHATMKLAPLLRNRAAVSPVIGVVLMFAITITLAAVVGALLLGVEGQLQSDSPQATFDFEFDRDVGGSGDGWDDDDSILITHTAGDTIDSDRLAVQLGSFTPTLGGWTGDVSAGDSERIVAEADGTYEAGKVPLSEFAPGAELRVVWTGPDGEQSATLASATLS